MANRIHDAFDSIQADDRLKETTKQFIQARAGKKSRFIYRAAFQGTLMFACMALVLAAGISGYSWIFTPVSYVSIDVNPSIELALNRLDRVVAAPAYNKEGEEILNDLSIKGKRYTDAIEAIMHDPIMQDYLQDDSELIFTVAADGGRDDRLKMEAENCSGHMGHGNSQSISVDLEIVSKAHDSGISLGKYYAWLQLMQYDDSITIDQCKNMSISKIHGLTKVHEQHESHDQDEVHDQHNTHEQPDESSEDSLNEQDFNDHESGQNEEDMQGSLNEQDFNDHESGQNEEDMQGSMNEQDFNDHESGQNEEDVQGSLDEQELEDHESGQHEEDTQGSMNDQDENYWDEYDASGHNSHHYEGRH